MSEPKKNTAYVVPIHLFKNGAVVTNPTIAAGDFEVITDDTSGGTLDTTPTVTPAAGDQVKISLSAAEMNGDYVTVICKDDTSPKAWDDVTITIQTIPSTIDSIRSTQVLIDGTADSGTTTTLVDAAALTQADDHWNGNLILFTSGTNIGQTRTITDFVASTDTVTFTPAVETGVTTETYEILPGNFGVIDVDASGRVNVGKVTDTTQTAGDLAALITTLDTVADAIKAVTDLLPDAGALSTIDTNIDSILTDTGTTLPATLATAANLATVDTVVDAIKVKTDDMVFTKANELDVNTKSINGATVVGDGNATPWDGA